MTPVEKVNEQIISNIKAEFPTIPFTAQEKLEDIARPAFKVVLDEIKSERCASYAQRTYPVVLVYFAVDKIRPKSECLAIYERLEPILYGMTDKIETEIDSQDAVLIAGFNVVDTVELTLRETDTGEEIENLELMEEIN